MSHVTRLLIRQDHLFIQQIVGGASSLSRGVGFPVFVLVGFGLDRVLDGVPLVFYLNRVLSIFAIQSLSQNSLFHGIFPSDLLLELVSLDQVLDERVRVLEVVAGLALSEYD